MDIESTLNSMIFFPTIKNGVFDYSTPMKSSITKFDIDKSTEPSQSLFEYLFYKMIKKKLKEGNINSETVLITEKFLTTFNCKKIFIKTKAIHKKHILIFLQNKNTLKWNLIAFLNLEEQLKNCLNETNKQPIVAKIISSNTNSDEDDYILNSTMDKLESTFDFKSPDDIQFEVDSINISDQPNTCIFLLNFIEGLIVQDDENLSLYIKRLYDEGSNTLDTNSKNYFNSFNRISEDLENIYIKYQNELNDYFKKNKNNILSFDAEKIMNGSNEIFGGIKNDEKKNLIGENGSSEGGTIVNGMEKNNSEGLNNSSKKDKIKDEIDMIQIEQDDDLDDDLNSDEEEEALKIMERENEEAKSQMRDQGRKLRQRLYKQKLRLKNINMYKEFGVIKEEDNESESESIDLFSRIKEEKEKNMNESLKISLKKTIEEKKNKLYKKMNNKSSSENTSDIILNTENNIVINDKNNDIKKEIFNKEDNDDKEQRSKSEKSIKLSVLRDLEEAIEEFESEIDINKNKEKTSNKNLNRNSVSNNKKKLDIKNSEIIRPIEKKNSIKSENILEEHNKKEKEKKYINIFKENLEIKKSNSISKGKEKEINLEDKNIKNEKLKKSLTNMKKVDKDKKPEKKIESVFIKTIKNNNDKLQKKSLKEGIKNNKNTKPSISINPNKVKDDNNSSNSNNTTNVYNTNSFNSNSNSSKSNEQDKSSNKEKDKDTDNLNKKEPNDNIIKKNIINSNSSKNKNNQTIKKTNSRKINEKPTQPLQTKISISSQKSSSTTKSFKTNSKSNGEKSSIKDKKKNIKEIEIKIEKNKITDFSALDNPLNVLPPQKMVERNGYYDLNNLNNKDKYKIENGSTSSFKLSQNLDINSIKSDKMNGDYSSNINIENIFSDDFESQKANNDGYEIKDEGSFLGESRIKKTTMSRKIDKKGRSKIPPNKMNPIPRTYNDYCNYDEEGANKICGCIGEQSNDICSIF